MEELLYIWNRNKELKGEEKASLSLLTLSSSSKLIDFLFSREITLFTYYYKYGRKVNALNIWNSQLEDSREDSPYILCLAPGKKYHGMNNPYNPEEILTPFFEYKVLSEKTVTVKTKTYTIKVIEPFLDLKELDFLMNKIEIT